MTNEPDVAVIIPVLNEEEGLARVLDDLPRARIREIVVVDNGSTDGSAAVARARGATVVPEPRRGYGGACLAGLAHLRRAPAERSSSSSTATTATTRASSTASSPRSTRGRRSS